MIVNGKPVVLHELSNSRGLRMSAINFGCRIVELWVPDRLGHFEDVVLGYDRLECYLNTSRERFMGAVCGRVANRIGNGSFRIDSVQYNLPVNNNGQTLHGGLNGLDSVVWDVVRVACSSIVFTYTSPDMEEGFPGTLYIEMCYELTDNNAFKITYSAKTDQPTPVNLTNHSFFNLKGEGQGRIDDRFLQIVTSHYTPVDKCLIPFGQHLPVADTPMDFRQPTLIGSRLDEPFAQFTHTKGYDHNWILEKTMTGCSPWWQAYWRPHVAEGWRCGRISRG